MSRLLSYLIELHYPGFFVAVEHSDQLQAQPGYKKRERARKQARINHLENTDEAFHSCPRRNLPWIPATLTILGDIVLKLKLQDL